MTEISTPVKHLKMDDKQKQLTYYIMTGCQTIYLNKREIIIQANYPFKEQQFLSLVLTEGRKEMSKFNVFIACRLSWK